MIRNSTLLYILDETAGLNELTDTENLLDFERNYKKELDYIFDRIDFSPSDKVIDTILRRI